MRTAPPSCRAGAANSVARSCSTCSKADWPCGSSTRKASFPSPSNSSVTAAAGIGLNDETNRELLYQLLRRPPACGRPPSAFETPASITSSCALRGHNFGGLVIPESAVITEKADDRDGPGILRPSAPASRSRSAAAMSAEPTSAPVEGVELTERRIRFAARWFGVKICVSGAGQPVDAAERQTIIAHLRRLGDTAARVRRDARARNSQGADAKRRGHAGPDERRRPSSRPAQLRYRQHRLLQSGADPCDELDKVKHLVQNVHFKDNRGGFEDWYFPAVGDGGAVDFARVRAILDGVGFAGPYTIEIEGIGGEPEPGVDAETRPRLSQCRSLESVWLFRLNGFFPAEEDHHDENREDTGGDGWSPSRAFRRVPGPMTTRAPAR